MNDLSNITEQTMSSREIAALTGKLHKNVLRDIEAIINELEGSDLSHHCKSSTYKTKQGKTAKEYLLDYEYTMTLITGYSIKLRNAVIKRWQELEKMSSEVTLDRLLEERRQGKIHRRKETDVIKVFIQYAKDQGGTPKGCDRYYTNLTIATNKALFDVVNGKPKNMRDHMDSAQLFQVGVADQAIAKALLDGMENGLHYKQIFQNAKAAVNTLSDVVGKSVIDNNVKLLMNSKL